MARIVLSDASPLIGLAVVSGLSWLKPLFGQVWVPPSVLREVLPESAERRQQGTAPSWRDEPDLRQALTQGWLREWKRRIPNLDLPDLDAGESECIRIASAHTRAKGNEALLIMDERAGRAVATEQGLRVAGTAAVIGMAKRQGLIASAREAFETLHRSDFRISADVIRTVLIRVGEAP
jgi:predicted nucleic acid-binding protein